MIQSRSCVERLLDEVGPYRNVYQRPLGLEYLPELFVRARKRKVRVLAQLREDRVLVTLKKEVGKE